MKKILTIAAGIIATASAAGAVHFASASASSSPTPAPAPVMDAHAASGNSQNVTFGTCPYVPGKAPCS
jgi:hypothetical protein